MRLDGRTSTVPMLTKYRTTSTLSSIIPLIIQPIGHEGQQTHPKYAVPVTRISLSIFG